MSRDFLIQGQGRSAPGQGAIAPGRGAQPQGRGWTGVVSPGAGAVSPREWAVSPQGRGWAGWSASALGLTAHSPGRGGYGQSFGRGEQANYGRGGGQRVGRMERW